MHCGYEPTAVIQTFSTLHGFARTARRTLWGNGQQPADDSHEGPTSDLPAETPWPTGKTAKSDLVDLPILQG